MSQELEGYLMSIVGQELLKEQQKELIERVQLKDARGRIQKSHTKINEYFEVTNLKYRIVPRRTSRIRYWEVLNWISFEEYLENYCSIERVKNILHKMSS